MFYIAETKLDWLGLVIENSYYYNDNGDLDKQIARLWAQYFNEIDIDLNLDDTYFLEE